jgi:hypothetical protein
MAKKRSYISGIWVQGFKSICAKQHIAIRPLTVLAGANSAGKSSVMQPLLLLKQTLEASGDPGALLLNGENVKFTRADQLLSKGSGDQFGVGVELSDGQALELTFRKAARGFDLKEMVYVSQEESFTIKPSMSHDAIMAVLPKPWKTMHRQIGKDAKTDMQWTARRERCFFVFEMTSPDDTSRRVRFGPFGVSPSQSFVSHIERIIHLPGLRGNPQRTYPKTVGGPGYQGTFEAYVASVIAEWQGSDSRNKLNELAHSLETLALTWKVKAEPVDDTQVELKVGRLSHARQGGAHDLVSIADVGFGVSQTLPVLVALLAARPGQMVYLEQPEIHLHPLAQRRLAKVIQEAVGRGVVVVVETHSAILLRELQTLIAVGELNKDDVAMHWLERNEQGETTVSTAILDDNGSFGAWPVDFDEVDMASEDAYLDAVESRGVSHGE